MMNFEKTISELELATEIANIGYTQNLMNYFFCAL